MKKPLTRSELVQILTAVSQVTLSHSDTCSIRRNGECYCACGERHELRNRVRDALKAEDPRRASQIEALEAVESAEAEFNAAFENQRRVRQDATPEFSLARDKLVSAKLRLEKIRRAED